MPRRPADTTQDAPRRPPLPFPPRGLSRQEAAAYVGVSAPLFDEMVKDGRMPPPKLVNARVIWDRVKVDAFFAVLPERGVAVGDTDGWEDWQ